MRGYIGVGAAFTACALLLSAHSAHAFKIDPWSYRPPGVSPARIESQIEQFLYNPRMLLLRPLALGSRVLATHSGALPAFLSLFDGFEYVTVSAFFEIRGNATPATMRRLGLGALLHTMQDSFAEGHAEREISTPVGAASGEAASPERFGAISALRDFTCQSEEKHGDADRAGHYAWFGAAAHGGKSPVTLGANLIDLITRKIKWDGALVAGLTEYMRVLASVVPDMTIPNSCLLLP